MNDDLDLVQVYSLTDPTRAEVIRIALEQEGIPCEIANEHQAGLTGILTIRLFVRARDEDLAKKLINAHEEPHD